MLDMPRAFLELPLCVVGVTVAIPEPVGVTIVKLVIVDPGLGMTGVPVATKIEVGTAMLVCEVVRVLFM